MSWQARTVRYTVYAALVAVTALVTLVLVFAIQARLLLADLQPWHETALDEEFRAGRRGAPQTFAEYLALEDRLFAELKRRVLDDAKKADGSVLGRYNKATVVSRLAYGTQYNRSFELTPAGEPRGAVLLVHGLTDSPYSVRGLAETFVAQGYYVLALRMPGHGTLPAGLLDVSWRDWYAAVELAAKHAAERAGPGRPLLAGGYSTGAALVTLYSLRALEDPALPRVQRLYLVSAAIGISPFARLTRFLSQLAFIPGFEKSRWLDVYPEYDPYKYNSFAVNAASQIYAVTRAIRAELEAARSRGDLDAMPRVTMFQSLVDSTVTPEEVVRGLLSHLPARGHELVVFDVNRNEYVEMLVAAGPLDSLERLRNTANLPFDLTIVSNRAPDTRAVAAFERAAGTNVVTQRDLPLEWPRGVFSVGHIALPFPPDDPVNGLELPAAPLGERFNIGGLAVRGENGALVVPLGTFARLRSNPFFDVMRDEIRESLAGASQ